MPCKVAVFRWRLLSNASPIRIELLRMGILIVIGVSCPLCGLEEKSLDHLFVGYCKVICVWLDVLSWLGMVGVERVLLVSSFEEVLSILAFFLAPSFVAFVWLLVCWCIWFDRNKVVFDNHDLSGVETFIFISKICWDWFSILSKGSGDKIMDDWHTNLRLL